MTKELLGLHSDYLLSSFGATIAMGLSRLLGGAVSHDQVTRLLSEKVKTSRDLWQIVKPLVRQVESEEGVLIFDDSIEEKPYTDENDIICWHYDHTQGRNVKGINFLAALCTFVKLESLRTQTKPRHYVLKLKLYVAALHSAFQSLQALQPIRLAQA